MTHSGIAKPLGDARQWAYPINPRVANRQRSPIRDMLALTSRPGIISFAGGLPSPDHFPVDQIRACMDDLFATRGRRVLQYNPPSPLLIEQIVAYMAWRGVTVRPEEVFITTGAQQALTILAQLLCPRNGRVVVEEFLYTGARQALDGQEPVWLPVPSRPKTGMDVDVVERYLATHGASMIYVVPIAQNPLGVDLGPAQRERLVALAANYRVPIVEDDPYGALQYGPETIVPLKTLDKTDGVLYCGSFSKILAPALRLGWIIALPELHRTLAALKETIDLETSALIQATVAEFCRRGYLWPHIEQLCQAYGRRRDAMLAALERSLPAAVRWTRPSGGMFIWVTLPQGCDTAEMLPAAVEQKVAYIPGVGFAVGDGGHNAMRLNFSNATVEQIEEGIERLAHVISTFLERKT